MRNRGGDFCFEGVVLEHFLHSGELTAAGLPVHFVDRLLLLTLGKF